MFWELVRIKLAVEFSFLSVQPRRNGSQNTSQYPPTLAQQLWSCNFLSLRRQRLQIFVNANTEADSGKAVDITVS
jgi:hypothetical protein